MMALKDELRQLTLVAYHATHLDPSKQIDPAVQKVLVTGNDIIWVVFLPLDTKIILGSIQLQGLLQKSDTFV